MSMNAPGKAAKTPHRRLKSTSTLWAGISRPPCSRFPDPEEQEELRKKEERKDRLHQNYLRRKANGKQKEWEERYNASARSRWRWQRPRSGPRTWKKAFLSLSASYPGRSRARPPYRPAPQFNRHSAKEDEHERIDLHPLRGLLHPRPETFRAAGGPHRQVWPYAATLPEGTPAGLYSSLILSEKLYPHLLEIDRAARERMDAMLPA